MPSSAAEILSSSRDAALPPLLTDAFLLRRTARRAAEAVGSLSPQGTLYEAHLRGNHGRRRAGSGDSFWQFRPLMPGDGADQIDWRRSARADGYFVRQYEWEAARDIWIACDTGKHMLYRSDAAQRSKMEEAAIICVALAHLFGKGGERVGLYGAMEKPIAGKVGTDRLAEALVTALSAPSLANVRAMEATAPPRRGSHTLWISDFLTPHAKLQERLHGLVRGGTKLYMVQVLDPSEEAFPFSGRIEFEGPSRQNGHLVESAQDIKARYLRRFSKHQLQVETMAREAGAVLYRHRTDKSLSPCLTGLSALFERT